MSSGAIENSKAKIFFWFKDITVFIIMIFITITIIIVKNVVMVVYIKDRSFIVSLCVKTDTYITFSKYFENQAEYIFP